MSSVPEIEAAIEKLLPAELRELQSGADLQSPIFRSAAPNVPAGFVAHAIVPGACKKTIRNQLHHFSIHREALFPGLDGISDHIKQLIERDLE